MKKLLLVLTTIGLSAYSFGQFQRGYVFKPSHGWENHRALETVGRSVITATFDGPGQQSFFIAGNTGYEAHKPLFVSHDLEGNFQWGYEYQVPNSVISKTVVASGYEVPDLGISVPSGFAMVGTTSDCGSNRAMFIRTNEKGLPRDDQSNPIPYYTYEGLGNESLVDIMEIKSKFHPEGFILVGNSGNEIGNYNGYLIKTNSWGVPQKQIFIEGRDGTAIKLEGIIEVTDGYLVYGNESIRGARGGLKVLLKIDRNLDILWSKTIELSFDYIPEDRYLPDVFKQPLISVTEDAKGDIVILGEISYYSTLGEATVYVREATLTKLSSLGDPLWSKAYPSGFFDFSDIKATTEGSQIYYLISGGTIHGGKPGHPMLIKTNRKGNPVFSKYYYFDEHQTASQDGNGMAYGLSIHKNEYILTGFHITPHYGLNRLYLSKTDSLGKLGSDKECKDQDFSINQHFGVTSAVDFKISATEITGYQQHELNLYGLSLYEEYGCPEEVKETSDKRTSSKEESPDTEPKPQYLHQNYPNPITESSSIRYSLPQDCKTAMIRVTDLSGRETKVINLTQDAGEIQISNSDLPQGLYHYTLIADGVALETRKMIINK